MPEPAGGNAGPPAATDAVVTQGGTGMADTTAGKGGIGITLGGALVIAGIVIAIFWSLIIGIIVALLGLVAFGGFVRGRWF